MNHRRRKLWQLQQSRFLGDHSRQAVGMCSPGLVLRSLGAVGFWRILVQPLNVQRGISRDQGEGLGTRKPIPLHWLPVTPSALMPLSAPERQSEWVLGVIHQGNFGRGFNGRLWPVTASLERAPHFTPVVYTCGVSVLQELRRTKAVLGGA